MAKIAIIGLGYVGLPLARLFLKKGHTVYGIDTDKKKIHSIKKGNSYISDITGNELKEMVNSGNFHVSTSFDNIKKSEAIILSVPTPLTEQREPDTTYIEKAVRSCLPYLQKGQLMILESSTYPGTTEEIILLPITEKGFVVGKDFYLAYSPERIDPGQRNYLPEEIPKIYGGVTPACTEKTKALYGTVFQQIVPVTSAKAAEMCKLLENAQRLINISFINELALLCDKMGLDVWEIIEACKTKPFGFTPYYPGPGAGGHCIPIDPIFLNWAAERFGEPITSIQTAEAINEQLPKKIVKRVIEGIKKPICKAELFFIGVTYKRDVNDIRESKAIEIMEQFIRMGATISYHDPYIPQLKIEHHLLLSVPVTEERLKTSDCTLILTDHTNLPYRQIAERATLIYDPRNALKAYKQLGTFI